MGWSDEVASRHGYRPGAVTPTAELLLTHKHPDYREAVASASARSIADVDRFSSRHRVSDTADAVHHVILVADRMIERGEPGGRRFGVSHRCHRHPRRTPAGDAGHALPELYAARSVIEQAKGALMLIYGIGPEQAFRGLSRRPQETDVELRALAARQVADLPGPTGVPPGCAPDSTIRCSPPTSASTPTDPRFDPVAAGTSSTRNAAVFLLHSPRCLRCSGVEESPQRYAGHGGVAVRTRW